MGISLETEVSNRDAKANNRCEMLNLLCFLLPLIAFDEHRTICIPSKTPQTGQRSRADCASRNHCRSTHLKRHALGDGHCTDARFSVLPESRMITFDGFFRLNIRRS